MTDLGSVNLGSAHSAILLDASGVRASVAEAQRAFQNGLQNIGGMVDALGGQMSKLGKSLTVLTAPLSVFGATGTKVAASFEEVMVQIKTFGGVAGKELDQVRNFVLKMGADTVFSAQEAGAAMLDLLKSGMSLQDAMKTLPTTLQLATIGNLGLAEATGIVTSAMAQFGLKAKDASKIAEALARGANASRADVRDLGQALANVGPVARNFGLSMDQTVAALAVLSNNGIQGAEAGTALKSMLLNLTRPTDETAKALKMLGVSLYDAKGNTKDFGVFLRELDAALDKLPIEQQNALMHQLAGSYGITGLSALRASGGIDQMMKSMKAAPSAAKLAAEQSNTFNRALESLRGSIETLQTVALTPFIENVLKPLVKQLIEVVNKVTEWAKSNPELVAGIVAFLTGLAAAGPVLFVFGTVLSQVGTIIGVIGAAIGALTSGPILALAGAVGALAAAWITNFGNIRTVLTPIIRRIGEIIQGVVGFVRQFFDVLRSGGTIWSAARSGFEALLRILEQLFAVNTGNRSTALGGLVDTMGKAQAGFTQFSSLMDNTLSPAFETLRVVFNNFVGAIQAGWNAIVGFVQTYVVPALMQFGAWFTGVLLPGIGGILQQVWPIVQSFFGFLGDVWAIVGPKLELLARWFLQDALPAIEIFITGVVLPAIQGFVKFLGDIWEAVRPGLTDLLEWFVNDGLPSIIDWISTAIEDYIKPLIKTLAGIWNAIRPGLQQFFDWFTSTGWPKIKEVVERFWHDVLEPFIEDLGRFWEETVRPAFDALLLWVQQHLPEIQTFFENGFKGIGTAIEGVLKWINDLLDKLEKVRQLGASLGVGLGVQASGATVTEDTAGRTTPVTSLPIAQRMIDLANQLARPGMESLSNALQSNRRAFGGEVLRGMVYPVNEDHTELFQPYTSGRVIPLGDMPAGGNNVTVQVPVNIGALGKLVDESDLAILHNELQQMGESVVRAVERARQQTREGRG